MTLDDYLAPKRIDKFDANSNGRDYICGDIHGCFDVVDEALENVGFDESIDRLFCVGDLVDRGPQSDHALKWLDYPWFYSVIGNHEDMCIQNYMKKDRRISLWHEQNGGAWFNALSEHEQKEFAWRFHDLPVIIQVGEYGILHAEPPLHMNNWNTIVQSRNMNHTADCLLWGRSRHNNTVKRGNDRISNKIDGIKILYVGHTPTSQAIQDGNICWIDTGAVFPEYNNKYGYLTLIHLNH